MSRSPRRRRRWLIAIGTAVMLLLAAVFAVLRLEFEGEDLGDNVASLLNKRMRGRIEIASIEWDSSSLKQVIGGGWVPLTMRGVRVWDDCALSMGGAATDEIRFGDPNEDCTPDDRPDPDPRSKRKPRKLLLRTELITAEIDIHALMFGNHDFVFRNLWVHGGEALLEQTREPYPLHAYDRVIVSMVTAFYPRMRAGFRAGVYADSPPPTFDLRDIHVNNLNVTIHMNPYSMKDPSKIGYVTTARLENVNVDAGPTPRNDSYLYMDSIDPLVAKFYVKLDVTAQRGTVRLWDEGARASFRFPYPGAQPEVYPPQGRSAEYQIALADIKLNRLAQLPDEWSRHDFVANTLELDLEARTLPCPTRAVPNPDPSHGARLHLTGELHDYWDRPYDGAWNLALDADNLGPTIRTCIKSTIGGDDLDGRITLTGPFVALPRIGLALNNLDFDIPLRAGEEPLRLTLAEVQGSIDLVNEQGSIDRTTALIRGGKEPGEVVLSANFGLKPYNARAHVEIVKPIDVERFLPDPIASSVGKFLQGRLSAVGDVDYGFALEDFDLSLGATPNERALRAHSGRLFTKDDFDTIKIQRVTVEAGQSRAIVDTPCPGAPGCRPGQDDAVDLLHETYRGVRIEGEFPDLDVWLKRFGMPAYVKSAGGGVIILNGPIVNPKINVATTLGGVPCLDKVQGNAEIVNKVVDLTALTSEGLGGRLAGRGRIDMRGAYPRIERLHLEGRRLDAARLCGLAGKVKGTLDTVDLDMAGSLAPKPQPIDWLDLVELEVRADKLTVLGDAYSNLGLCINRKNDAVCRPRAAYLDDDDLAQCDQGKRDRTRGEAFCAVASATRDQGGTLDATVAKLAAVRSPRQSLPARLGGTIALADVPLSILDTLLDTRSAGGLASLTLHLQGEPGAPTADGAVQLLRSWLANSFIGDAQLAVTPGRLGSVPALELRGSALAGRLQISGLLGTAAPYPVELSLTGRRIEIDVLLDLQKRFGLPLPVEGWASGTVTVKTELAPAKPIEPEAWVELTELRAQIAHRSVDGRQIPLVFNAMCRIDVNDPEQACAFEGGGPERIRMSILVTPSSIELACKDPAAPGGRVACGTRIATPAGVVVVKGYARPKGIAIEAKGTLELAQIQPLVDTMFDQLYGQADLSATITGTFAKPNYEAALALRGIVAKPVGGDTVINAPSGLVKLVDNSLGFTDVRVRIGDERKDRTGELHIKGNIGLVGLDPVSWGLLIDGKIAGEMLLVLMPGVVSQASGLARIDGDLMLTGKGPLPSVSGTIVFDPAPPCVGKTGLAADGGECRAPDEQSLAVIPRGVRREIAFTNGSVDIETETRDTHRTYKIELKDVGASINGEGTLSRIQGRFELRDGALTSLSVALNADSVPFRLPGELDLILSAQADPVRGTKGIQITKDGEDSNLDVRGDITIIDGAYLRNFQITDRITSIGVTAPPSRPFWEEYPTIGNAELHLGLEIRQFAVNNNLASIDLKGRLAITSTPRDPRVEGTINVVRGRFRIPGTRAAFERTAGTIQFKPNERINPELAVTSDADYRDLSGQDHLITLRIFGQLDQLQWDLKTSTGYNKSQTLSLLVLGRNPESLRHSLGDQTLGANPANIDPTTNPSQGFADQIVKDLAGDWVSGLLGDSLSKITGLDVLRIEIGFGSIGFVVEKKILENLKLLGNTEQTIRGNTVTGRAELRTPVGVSVQLGYLNKNFNDPAEQDIEDTNLKLVYRLFIP